MPGILQSRFSTKSKVFLSSLLQPVQKQDGGTGGGEQQQQQKKHQIN